MLQIFRIVFTRTPPSGYPQYIRPGPNCQAPQVSREKLGYNHEQTMRYLKLAVAYALLVPICLAVQLHEIIPQKVPVRKVAGRVVGFGPVNPGVTVRVFDKPEVWSDDSITLVQKRQTQKRIASAVTDSSGMFYFPQIQNGSYEVEFSGRAGWNTLSVFVVVGPFGSSDQLCVAIGRSSAGDKTSLETLPACGRTLD